MERFEKRLKMRLWACRILIVLMLIAMVVIGEMPGGILLDSRTMDQTAQSVSRMLFFGTLVALVIYIGWMKRLLSRRLERRERQIIEEDERRMTIRQQSGALAMNMLLALLMAAVFVLAFVDMTAFYTAYAVLLTAAALRFGLAWYFSKQI